MGGEGADSMVQKEGPVIYDHMDTDPPQGKKFLRHVGKGGEDLPLKGEGRGEGATFQKRIISATKAVGGGIGLAWDDRSPEGKGADGYPLTLKKKKKGKKEIVFPRFSTRKGKGPAASRGKEANHLREEEERGWGISAEKPNLLWC